MNELRLFKIPVANEKERKISNSYTVYFAQVCAGNS
jgi:hypothetical protein